MTLTDQNIKRRYGAGAEMYDDVMSKGWRSLINRPEVVQALRPRADARYLEVGVGTGLNVPFYPKGTHWHGVDLTPSMLEVAEEKKYRCNSVEFGEMSGASLTYPADFFDGVLCTLVVSASSQPSRLLEESFRVTRIGGGLSLFDVTVSRDPEVRVVQEELVNPYSTTTGFPAPSKDFPNGVIVYSPLRDMAKLVKAAGWLVESEARSDEHNPFTCRTHVVARKGRRTD